MNWKTVATLALLGAFAFGQNQTLIMGRNPTGQAQNVSVDTGGNITVSPTSPTPAGSVVGTHGACVVAEQTIGTAVTLCPLSPSIPRSSISVQLLGPSTAQIALNPGGGTGSTAGFLLNQFDVYKDNLGGTVNLACFCSLSSCQVLTVECP